MTGPASSTSETALSSVASAPGADQDPRRRAAQAQSLPPVTELGMLSLALIVAGGIYLAAHLPEHVPLAPAAILLACSAALLAINLGLLARVPAFPWGRLFAVARWVALAYVVIAGMIEYVFLRDHISGGPLVVLTLSLVIFAIHIPILVGFTVARYARD